MREKGILEDAKSEKALLAYYALSGHSMWGGEREAA